MRERASFKCSELKYKLKIGMVPRGKSSVILKKNHLS